MKRYMTILLLFLAAQFKATAQGEDNIWTFGNRYSLDFNYSPPLLRDSILLNGQLAPSEMRDYYQNTIVACNAAGQMQFMVQLTGGLNNIPQSRPSIMDTDLVPIPGTHLLNEMIGNTGGDGAGGIHPLVIPHPGNGNQYYIFYERFGGLHYSLFDMSLNNGTGQIIPGQHNILISGYNTISRRYITTVTGCTGVWLVARSKEANEYKSFLVDNQGIHVEPVVSEVGLLPMGNYGFNGILNASQDGRMLAIACPKVDSMNPSHPYSYPGGLELYDFEPCSGKITNPRVLDTGQRFYGICFSPDNSKLYATQNYLVPGYNNGYNWRGSLFQFDLDQPSLSAIAASKTLIIENPYYSKMTPWGCYSLPAVLGDVKAGPDGKLYLLNYYSWACSGSGMAFHVIEQPNNAGLSCGPLINEIFNTLVYVMSDTYYGMYTTHTSEEPYFNLPRQIKVAPPPPDTLPGTTQHVIACFTDSLMLGAATDRQCYRWENGSTGRERTVDAPGTYWVSYFIDCSYTTDTFRVNFSELPNIPSLSYGCPGDISLAIENIEDGPLQYALINGADTVRQGMVPDNGLLTGLDAGSYGFYINNAVGCDTLLPLILEAYPAPEMTVSPSDTTIRYGEQLQLTASGAEAYTWFPPERFVDRKAPSQWLQPFEPLAVFVVGSNEYDCVDTGFVKVGLDYVFHELVPNAFSPNGDGLNDVFRIEGAEYQMVDDFSIYDRFGKRVFQTFDANLGWDGTFNGQPCDVGTYYYSIRLRYPGGTERTYKGDITLLR